MRKAHWPTMVRHETDEVRDMQSWLKFRAGAWITHDAKHRPVFRGITDLLACIPVKITQAMVGRTVGVFCAIEVKAEGVNLEKPAKRDKAQEDFQADVARHGGVVIRAHKWQELERALKIRGWM